MIFAFANKWKPMFGMMDQYDGIWFWMFLMMISVVPDLIWHQITLLLGHHIFVGRLKSVDYE